MLLHQSRLISDVPDCTAVFRGRHLALEEVETGRDRDRNVSRAPPNVSQHAQLLLSHAPLQPRSAAHLPRFRHRSTVE